ncbi:mitochondrial carrier protein, putative [Trypanosoma brucei gambiense DAL972]|uniref:Mitochondrial carrier protein, putative n=2 Tax=Trypanosoma brucei TaxID=5691 RepID=C9ZM27_TRYB9|nr:mitochondrial carrier protein, putative [Trypanosoma brucei gambiense DAL972]RHW72747.1 mitochondrial carrier protein [Trypanosoma brucei equiperdum]CBH10452.1 mitochondrial carrier protein, putative [Trypanosoma brucei gambiense DAL972]|eukprot:XP_011772742.1 mitochondrial carrier protein, putative [Trypanosoma brucei gambiense DAL972]
MGVEVADCSSGASAQNITGSEAMTVGHEKAKEQHMHVKRDSYTTAATFVAGGVAGACSRTLTAPLDRIKIIVQEGHLVSGTGKKSLLRPAQLIDVFHLIRNDGGWSAFWRGNGVNCLKAGPEFALVFTLRRYFLSLYEDSLDEETARVTEWEAAMKATGSELIAYDLSAVSVLPAPLNRWFTLTSIPRILLNFLIGAWAGFGAQLTLYPLEVIKTRMAVSRRSEYPGGMRQVIYDTYKNSGISGFYRGLTPNMVGIFIYRGLEVGIYSTAQQQMIMYRMNNYGMSRHDSSLSSIETAAVSMFASMFAQTVSYPLNVVRTRLQTQGTNGRAVKYKGMTDCFVKMVRTKGVGSLFSGISANYLKAVPASASMFVVFEKVQSILVGDD